MTTSRGTDRPTEKSGDGKRDAKNKMEDREIR